MSHGFLPISKEDMKEAGIEQLDFVYICGDAYVDHPSFGHAIISRILEAHGYKVGIIAQPDWKDRESINRLGEPRLGLSCFSRKYGLHGQSLFRFQEKKNHGCIYTGRCDGKKTGLCHDCIL